MELISIIAHTHKHTHTLKYEQTEVRKKGETHFIPVIILATIKQLQQPTLCRTLQL
jgi:hypothetical protein